MALIIIEKETESKSSKPQKGNRAALDDEFSSKLLEKLKAISLGIWRTRSEII